MRDFGSMNDRSGLQKRTLLQSMCLRRFVPKRTYARQQSEPPLDDLVGMAEQRQPLPPTAATRIRFLFGVRLATAPHEPFPARRD